MAILLVMIFHFTPAALEGSPLLSLSGALAEGGWMGVDIFFVLSGFLITRILLKSKGKDRYFSNFYIRRSLRILPLYFCYLSVIFFILPWFIPFDTPGLQLIKANQLWLWLFAQNLAYVYHGRVMFASDWLNLGALWSLAVEEHFYLVWPLVVYYCSRRQLVAWIIFGIVFALLLRILLVNLGMRSGATYFMTPCRVDSLLLGAITAVLFERNRDGKKLLRIAKVLFAISALGWIGICAGQGSASVVPDGMRTIGFSLVAIASAAGIFILTTEKTNIFNVFFSNGLLRVFGKFSYAMYLLHIHWLLLLDWLIPRSQIETSGDALGMLLLFVRVSVGILVTLLSGILCWHLIERHFLAMKKVLAPE